MDNQQGPPVWHRELYWMLQISLDRRGVWWRRDTCICMAESLHCSPETITTLWISYPATQNKKFKVWGKKAWRKTAVHSCLQSQRLAQTRLSGLIWWMDGQRLPALHNLLGWCPGPRAQVPWHEMHPNLCLPSSLVQPWGPPIPYSACCSQGAAQPLKVMMKLPRDQSFPGITFILISPSQMRNYKVWRNFQDLKRVSRQELPPVYDCQLPAWTHRDTCWYKACKHTRTHTHMYTLIQKITANVIGEQCAKSHFLSL